ncbi:MAG: hypothetical protein WA782_13880 [Sulfitobacter sp.]
MYQQEKFAQKPAETDRNRGVAQVIFVLTGLAIIIGGIWSLYMADAPYHPQDQVSRDSVSLTEN